MTAVEEVRPAPALARVGALAREVLSLRGWLALALTWFCVMSHLEIVNPARPLRMSIPLHAFVSAAGAFGLPALGLMRRRAVSARGVFAVLWFLCLALLVLANWRFVISHVDQHPIVAQIRGIVRIAVLVLLALVPLAWFGKTRLVSTALALVAGLMLLDRARVLAASTDPRIDVFTLANEAAAAFWRGENPYAAEYSNLYEATKLDLGYSPGYNYFPAMLVANALSAKLFGDVRALYVLAEVACAFFIFRFARAFAWELPETWAVTALFCCNSLSFQVVEKWNDALVLACVLGMLAMLAEQRWLLAGVAFGFGAASKQYVPLAVAPLAIWLWRSGPPKSFHRVVLGAALGGGLVSLPFLVNQPNWLLHRTVLHFAGTPFRDESLSLLNLLRGLLDFDVDSWAIRVAPWFGLAAGMGAACLITWRCSRPEGDPDARGTQLHRLVVALLFLWAGFFQFIKQSFLNYHYFSLGVSVLLLVSLTERPGIVRFAGRGRA
jgi:Glycosyltransferase family 87